MVALSMVLGLLHCTRVNEAVGEETEAKLADAFALLKRAVAQRQIPGAVALVARHGKVIREEAMGLCDIENQVPFRTDTICWLASITKPVTTAAAMKLVEEGKLRLDDAVENYLPEFRRRPTSRGGIIRLRCANS